MGLSEPIAQVRKLALMKKREAGNRRTSWNCAEANSRRRRDNSLRRPPACFCHASSDACRHPEEALGSERSSQVKATHERTQRDPPRCKSIEQEKGRKNESLSITSRCLCLSPLKNLFGREQIRVRPRRDFPKEPGRDKNTPLRKGWFRETSGSAVSGARMEPESRSGARAEHGTPKGRSGSRNYIIPKPQDLFLGGSMAPQAYQTLISLPIYMATGMQDRPCLVGSDAHASSPGRGVLSHAPRMSARNVGGFARVRKKTNGQERCGTGDRIRTQVAQQRSTTAVIVSSQRSSPPAEPFSLSTQNELYGYECRTNQGLRSTESRTLQPTGKKNT